ncbi:hypothetical protein LPJ56_002723, partial [Coemansia sp. RSA 2599]
CFFSHDVNLFVEKNVCKYFVKGNCRYGNKCALIHSGQNDAQSRSQTKSSGNGHRNAQNGGPSNSSKSGNGTRGVGNALSGNSRKDRRQNAEPSYSDAASGRMAAGQQAHRASPGAAASGASSSSASASASTTTKSQNPRGSANDRLQSAAESPSTSSTAFRDIPLKPAGNGALNSGGAGRHGSGKMLASSWAPGSLTSALRREQNQRSQAAALLGHKEQPQTLRADSGVMEFGNSTSRIQSSYHQQSALRQDEDLGDFSVFADQLNDKTVSPFGMHYGAAHGSSSGIDIELNAKSQPIPKPVHGASWARRGGDSAMALNGLSMQDSLRIDKLALSHSAAHQSFTGSPFLSSMIPLLDQFSDAPRNESSFALGDSPMASPFASSPVASHSGAMLNRHAFSVVDPLAADAETGGSSLLRVGASYHGHSHSHLQHHGLGSSMRNVAENGFSGRLDMSPSLKPIGNGIAGRSVPRNNELFGRSFRSSSFINEPLSPLAAFATANDNAEAITPSALLGAAPLGSPMSASGNNNGSGLTGLGGRLRSNSHLHSPSLSGLASGVESGSIPGRPLMQDRPLGSFSLADTHLHGTEQQQRSTGNAGLWDSYNSFRGNESGNEQESRHPFAFSLNSSHLGNQRLGGLMQPSSSLSHMYQSSHQQQQQQQHWARSPQMSLQGSGQASPFATAIGSLGAEPRQLTLPPLASGAFGSDAAKPGAIGQKPHRSNLSSLGMAADYNGGGSGGGQHRSAFNGVESSLSALNIPGVGNGSVHASSTPSEQYDEIFELEQDAPGGQIVAGGGSSALSNSQFPSMNGLSQKLSGISLAQSRVGGSTASQSMANISAIARPSI